MNLDIERLKDLIAKREEIDAEIISVTSGAAREKKPVECSICKQAGRVATGHTARSCEFKHAGTTA